MSKVGIVYYSKTGNTKKLALAIGEELSCFVNTVHEQIDDKIDILFIGASVYKCGQKHCRIYKKY